MYHMYVCMHESATLLWLLVQWFAAYLFLQTWISCRVTWFLSPCAQIFIPSILLFPRETNGAVTHDVLNVSNYGFNYLYKGKEGGGSHATLTRYHTYPVRWRIFKGMSCSTLWKYLLYQLGQSCTRIEQLHSASCYKHSVPFDQEMSYCGWTGTR